MSKKTEPANSGLQLRMDGSPTSNCVAEQKTRQTQKNEMQRLPNDLFKPQRTIGRKQKPEIKERETDSINKPLFLELLLKKGRSSKYKPPE